MGVCPISSGPLLIGHVIFLNSAAAATTFNSSDVQFTVESEKTEGVCSWSDVQNLGCVYINI